MGRILLAEDDEVFCRLVCSLLEAAGHSVYAANNGSVALLALSKDQFDMAIADLIMPDQDGLGFLRAAKDLAPALPVVIMTGYVMPPLWEISTLPKYLDMALSLGASEVLYKPFTIEELNSVVERCLIGQI